MTRRRFVYTRGGQPLPEPVEVTDGFVGGDSRMPVFTDRYMEGDRATDGTDIGSRTKRRAYMQAHGLADASDYTQAWEKARMEREAQYRGTYRDPTTRADVARAIQQVKRRR
jgi:hypothetical protein